MQLAHVVQYYINHRDIITNAMSGYNTPNMDVAVAAPPGIVSKLRSLKAEDKRRSNVLIFNMS